MGISRTTGLASLCVIAAACSAVSEAETDTSAITAVDRKLVGEAAPYIPDVTRWQRNAELASSVKERRRVAWDVVRRVIEPVTRELPTLPNESLVPGKMQLPRFQTWYSSSDFEALTGHVL